MAYPITGTGVSLSGGLIPTIWAPKFLIKFYEDTILTKISNTDYEGEIKKQGDTVRINTLPDITINDHSIGQTLTYEEVDDSTIDLVIEKGKSYSFVVPDVSKKQSALDIMEAWSGDAAQQMKITIERSIFADIYSDADTTNSGSTAGAISGNIDLGATGAAVTLTSSNIIEFILKMGVCLDENDVPQEDRWCILPSYAIMLLKNSDIKDASVTGDGRSTLRTGLVGGIDRFTVYQSNLLSRVTDGTDTVTNIMAGHKSALTFASQLTENEVLRSEDRFADYARGLQVYGYKVVKPTALVHGYVIV